MLPRLARAFAKPARVRLRPTSPCQPRRLQWVMLMNPSFSNAPISNLLETIFQQNYGWRETTSFIFLRWGAPDGVA